MTDGRENVQSGKRPKEVMLIVFKQINIIM